MGTPSLPVSSLLEDADAAAEGATRPRYLQEAGWADWAALPPNFTLPNITFPYHEDLLTYPNASLLENMATSEELITSKDGTTTGKCCSCRGEPRIMGSCGRRCTTCRGCCHGMSL